MTPYSQTYYRIHLSQEPGYKYMTGHFTISPEGVETAAPHWAFSDEIEAARAYIREDSSGQMKQLPRELLDMANAAVAPHQRAVEIWVLDMEGLPLRSLDEIQELAERTLAAMDRK